MPEKILCVLSYDTKHAVDRTIYLAEKKIHDILYSFSFFRIFKNVIKL